MLNKIKQIYRTITDMIRYAKTCFEEMDSPIEYKVTTSSEPISELMKYQKEAFENTRREYNEQKRKSSTEKN